VIVDTGILVALADRADRNHRAAAAVFSLPEPKIVPEPVVVEADWMILKYLGVTTEIAFLKSVCGGQMAVESSNAEDRERAAVLVERYADAEIGYVDGVVVAVAERLRERRVATLDRRHFSLVVPRHAPAFEILP